MTRLFSLLAAVLLATAACAEVVWQDDFREPMRYEYNGPRCWTIGEGKCAFRAGAADSRLVTLTSELDNATVEAELTLDKRLGTQWTFAGIGLVKDPLNHWQLMLVEGPEGQHYFELIEKLNGEHQAQLGLGAPAARLEGRNSGKLQTWEYGMRYKLTLKLTPEEISGTVADPASGEMWQRSFSFARGLAVKTGRAALIVNGMSGAFGSLRVQSDAGQGGEALTLKTGPAGSVAILKDEANAVAPGLAKAFEQAGYGVTPLDWEQIGAAKLPPDKLDLLVLADARRLPVGARDELVNALHSGGKVMAIGAPALSELLVKTPEGWRGPADWARSFASQLRRTPLTIPQADWKRNAMDQKRAASLALDPAGGESCWKATTDLHGWDTNYAAIPGGFGADRSLLVFEAKGDAQTPQMSVECVETDHSRWIATADLSSAWQTYVLRPADFPYWNDSDAKGRGGAGDHVRPADVVTVAFGLASSHTHKVKDGPHTYWFRGLATAPDEGLPAPDFGVPDIEALCPSYKLYPLDDIAGLRSPGGPSAPALMWAGRGYSPIWREQGRGFNRGRSWRWVPMLEALDEKAIPRGALISLMIGDGVSPNAVWANVGVADPARALDAPLLAEIVRTAKRMTQGEFLLEGGAEQFSYLPGEKITFGAKALNTGRTEQKRILSLLVLDSRKRAAMGQAYSVTIAPGRAAEVTWNWQPPVFDPLGYEVRVQLQDGQRVIDTISHRIEALRSTPAGPEEFVRVEGSNFTLNGKPWFFKGINYWPSWVGGYLHLGLMQRETYDPEVIERDLSWLQSIGVNALSAVQGLIPPDPEAPGAFRDQLDFLNRCDRHGMKVHFFMPNAWPYHGADLEKVKQYITRAGIKDHPAILSWELSWEPIENPWQNRLDFILDDWNRWIVERYGSLESAEADWAFKPERTKEGKISVPTTDQCRKHGEWDRYVAAFRRGFSDLISAKYRDIAEPLRAWDPKHLVTFRGGACGIPSGGAFAHEHSVGVAKHVDFLCPEGYNLQTSGWGTPTPADEIRRGGFVTQYYRFISREKPVVWMEFGYTVNGINTVWEPGLVHLKPERLQDQKTEYESFYAMFVESGARGAAPWWLPGGFRLGENSDFGIIEPDGTPRPVCDVLLKYLPQFEQVQHRQPDHIINLDFDRHYPDAWETYSAEYLAAVKAGQTPGLRTAGTGTDSATCPLTAVGGGEYNGHNPPQFLNAEFNRLELKIGDGPWREVRGGETLEAPQGARVLCRASLGNLGEAKWLAPQGGEEAGRVFLAGRKEYGLEFRAPIAADAAFLADAEVKEFTLIPALTADTMVSFEMLAVGRASFGERRTVVVKRQG